MGSNTWRVVNNHDIVPHLPPKSFDFNHVNTEVWEHGSQYQICNQSGEDPKCSDSLILPDSIPDHLSYMQLDGGLCWGEEPPAPAPTPITPPAPITP